MRPFKRQTEQASEQKGKLCTTRRNKGKTRYAHDVHRQSSTRRSGNVSKRDVILLTLSLTSPSRQAALAKTTTSTFSRFPLNSEDQVHFCPVAFQTPTSKPPEVSDKGNLGSTSETALPHSVMQTSPRQGEFFPRTQSIEQNRIYRQRYSVSHRFCTRLHLAHLPPYSRPTNLPAAPPVMDPSEAARLAIEKCNSLSDSMPPSSTIGEPKLTIFV